MELDELKKSWNALDEHLKDKKLVKDEDISQLINHATKNINAISRLNKRLRIISLTIIHIGPVIRRCIPGYLLSDYSHSSDTGFRMGYIQFPLSQQYKDRRTAACYCYFPLQPYASLGNP